MSFPPLEPALPLTLVNERRKPLEQEVTELFDQLRNPLFRYLMSLGLPAHDGEEVIQEVFLSLFQHLRRGRPRDNLRGWIFRVGHNLALKHRNRHRAETQCEDIAREDPAMNPEQQFAWGQRYRRLQAVIRALPEQDRFCLYLRAEGLRYREIAEVLGISLGGVALSLERALDRLNAVRE